MPEIQPDMSDPSRCISVHWSLPVQCVLSHTHAENWHEAWNPETGDRIRYRRSMGVFRTEELQDGWHDLKTPPPGDRCACNPNQLPADFDPDPGCLIHGDPCALRAEVERLRTTDQGVRDLIARLRAKDEIESDEIADMIERAAEGGAR